MHVMAVSPASNSPAAWPPAAQRAAVGLLVLAISLIGWHRLSATRWFTQPTTLEPATLRVDLNDADEAALRQLPGVGEALARRILKRREQLGAFSNVDDLRGITGIGPATLDRLRPLVQVGETNEKPRALVRAVAPTESDTPGSKKTTAGRIDVNQASVSELRSLPGIGPKMADAIVAGRPFKSVDDLRRVRGIGVKRLEQLRPHLTLGSE
jgi:competence protein ComEA